MNKNCLISGGNGFVGSHVSTLFAQNGFCVWSLSRSARSINEKFTEFVSDGKIVSIKGDVCNFDFESMPKQVDVVVHVAGKVSAWGDWQDFEKINIGGTKRMLEWAKNAGCKTFTFISSACVFGYDGYVNITETHKKTPFNNPYCKSKLIAEEIVQAFCKKNNMNFVIIRPGNVYGQHDTFATKEIFERVEKQKMIVASGGKNETCFVHVQNLANAIFLATTTKEAQNEDFNITDGRRETLKEFLTVVANQYGVKARFSSIPSWIAKIAATKIEIFHKIFRIKKAPLLTRFTVWQNSSNYSFSIEKAKKTFAFNPTITFEEGCQQTIEWLKAKK